jgi:O-antigen/teichoic acid export membrane protein
MPDLNLNFIFSNNLNEPAARRSSLLRVAIVTSGFSKVFGLGLQALAIPLVYHALGQHQYELYLLLSAAIATLAITQMGAGPGLTQGIAIAHAKGDREYEASLLGAAFRLVGAAAVLGGGAILIVSHFIAPEKLFGAGFAVDRIEIIHVVDSCVGVLMAQIVFGVVDSALAGYQEQALTNIGAMFSNILSIGVLIAICHFAPSISGVIWALYGLPTVSRIVNLGVLFSRRPYLLSKLTHAGRGLYGKLFSVGLAFWLMQIGGVLEQNGGTYLLARFSTTEGTNLFAIVFKSLSLAGAVVVMLTQPLWPAFTDAIAHKDVAWIQRAYTKIRRLLAIYSCALALVLSIAGRWFFQNVMHVNVGGNRLLFPIFGAYFIANIWTHLSYVTMMGMSGIWKITVILLVENLLMLIFGAVLAPSFGPAGMAIAYLAASVSLPVWLLPRMMHKAINDIALDAHQE